MLDRSNDGEVQLTLGNKGLLRQRDDGFGSLEFCGGTYGALLGAGSPRFERSSAQTPQKMARPPHNFGAEVST
jgi:hypothetical protein